MATSDASSRDRAGLVAISEIGSQLLREDSDLDAARSLVAERTRDLLAADVILWWTGDEDRTTVAAVVAPAHGTPSSGESPALPDSAVLATLRTGVPTLVQGPNGRRRLLAPVEVSRRRTGVLDVKAPAAREDFDAADLAAVSALAERLGSAMTARVLRTDLQHRANHDELTGLPNRSQLMAYISRMLRETGEESGNPAVVFVDIDRFKYVNDSLGHAVGDQVLVGTARRIRSLVRHEDFLARFGGDEFVIVLDDGITQAELQVFLARLTEPNPVPLSVGTERIYVTMSAGLARRSPGEDADTLLRHADAAMYHAKLTPTRRWAEFDRPLQDRVLATLRGEAELREAIYHDQLFCLFQPVVDLATMTPVVHEALVRWEHPRLGVRLPADFIALAEETRLIVPLTDVVLGVAIGATSGWPERAAVAVNLSGRHLSEPTLAAHILEALERHGAAPSRLMVEITETAVMVDRQGAMATLRALSEAGVRVAVDDFGTGYTSIEDLTRFPIDVIKLDRAFVAAAGTARGDAMLAALLALTAALETPAVAEGIETVEQLEAVIAAGCAWGQGFLLGQPGPAAEVSHAAVSVG
jgi:diguanylate cyclase (GGDEF)-like protein